ncbi:MAG: uroporphyrinogen decarboxylase family protein [Thermoproteota archaeon]
MNINVEKWVKKASSLLDLGRIDEAKSRIAAAWNFKPVERPPLIINCPPPEPWPVFKYYETYYDMDKMLLSQLASVYSHAILQDDGMPCVRANYGVGIIPSGFGSDVIIQPDSDQMPWVKEPVLKKDPPDLGELKDPQSRQSLMTRVIETEEYFVRKLDGTGIQVYLCDTQGPLDIAYLLRGPKLLSDFYRRPDFAIELLKRVAEVYVEFSVEQKKIIGEPLTQGVHGTPNVWMDKGGVRLCEDVAVMMNPAQYRKFCIPVNEFSVRLFGGAMGHFCCSGASDGKQVLEPILSSGAFKAFFFGSPARFYGLKETVELFQRKRVCLIWTDGPEEGEKPESWVRKVSNSLEDKTGVVFSMSVGSFNVAREILNEWERAFR